MASIAEDLTKGIGVDEAVAGALTFTLPREAYEWADKAAPPPQSQQQTAQQQAQALARSTRSRSGRVHAGGAAGDDADRGSGCRARSR